MITPRQKNRSPEAVPVLFRLPNLRVRGSAPGQKPIVMAPLEPSISSSPPMAPADKTVEPASGSIDQQVIYRFDFKEAVSPPSTLADSATPVVSQPVTGHDGSRSWMERIGSRLILVVTLLVIVSATWITQKRMPGNRLQTPTENQMAELGISEGDLVENDLAEVAGGVTNDTPAAKEDESQPLTKPGARELLASRRTSVVENRSDPGDTFSNTDAETAAVGNAPPTATLDPPSVSLPARASSVPNQLAAAPMESLDLLPPLQSPATPSHQSSKPALNAMPAAAMPEPTEPELLTDQSFYTPDAAVAREPLVAQTVSSKTRTPNAIAMDPSTMPWAVPSTEPATSPSPPQTSTPHAINNWSLYLPASTSPPANPTNR